VLCAATAVKIFPRCRSEDLVISCENGHVIKIHLAIVGHVGACKSGTGALQAIPNKADCIRPEPMDDCNEQRTCTVPERVFNKPNRCHKGRSANGIVVLYECVSTGKRQCWLTWFIKCCTLTL